MKKNNLFFLIIAFVIIIFVIFLNNKNAAISENKKRSSVADIVIVNTGLLSREEIGKSIEVINNEHPKIIGVNILFKKERPSDFTFLEQLKKVENIVFIRAVESWGLEQKILRSYFDIGSFGFDNLLVNEDGKIDDFYTTDTINGIVCPSFAEEIVKKVAPDKYKIFVDRKNKIEGINYIGNQSYYKCINYSDILDSSQSHSIFKDKIVLIGYLGKDGIEKKPSLDDEDICILSTPRNKDGEFQKIHSTIVWANIIDMILNESYVDLTNKSTGGRRRF
jgi:CHASE2 domain-containing sensor protein